MKTNKLLFVTGIAMIFFFCILSFAMSKHTRSPHTTSAIFNLKESTYKAGAIKQLLEHSERQAAYLQQKINVLNRPHYLDEAEISGDNEILRETKAYQQNELSHLRKKQILLTVVIKKYNAILASLESNPSRDTFAHK